MKAVASSESGKGLHLGDNYCDGTKPASGFANFPCSAAVSNEIEQSGANVTLGFMGDIDNGGTSSANYNGGSPTAGTATCAEKTTAEGRVGGSVANDVTACTYPAAAGNNPPITAAYHTKGLCPVNVHWHLGAEHLSVGEYDEKGVGSKDAYAKK